MAWRSVFGIYTAIAIGSTLGMVWVDSYPKQQNDNDDNVVENGIFYKTTAAIQLWWLDAKLKYMFGLNAVFGFVAAFVNSYVNGQVVKPQNVGFLAAWLALCAAITSLVLGKVTTRKAGVLCLGSLCFFSVAFVFLLHPTTANTKSLGMIPLVLVYTSQGMGRATFEATLKATFADYFPQEKEGAFANIILQNGLCSTVGYILSIRWTCSNLSPSWCVEYNDGSLHNVRAFALLVCGTALLSVLGILRAAVLYNREQDTSTATHTRLEQQPHGDQQGEPA